MRFIREKSACLVIDIQERLYPVMYRREALLRNNKILLTGMQVLQVPVIVSQQYSRGLGETIGEIRDLFDEFQPVEKRAFSCCDVPGITDKLTALGVSQVFLCGIESHVCVLQTALDLKALGYVPVVVMDCVSSRHKNNLKIALERFRYEGIPVTSAESVLFELTRTSEAPEFKAISNLVR